MKDSGLNHASVAGNDIGPAQGGARIDDEDGTGPGESVRDITDRSVIGRKGGLIDTQA